MIRRWFRLSFIAAMVAWMAAIAASSPTSFAQQTISGGGTTALNATGGAQGVAITGNTTLTVGTVGGAITDVFTNNINGPFTSVAVSTAASSQGNITFNSGSTVYGAIGVTQPGGPFLLNISGGNDGTAVIFKGPVFATTTTVSGTGSLNFNSGSSNTTATNFAADGTISLAPNTTVIGALTTNTAKTGTLSLGSGSTLDGAVGGANGLKSINVVGGTNTTGVSANITGAVDSHAFSLGTNTLNIGGALTIANGGAGGVINTTLASSTVFGNIRPTGATNLGPSLTINVTVPATTFLSVGTQFNIVQTATGTPQSGTNGTVLTVVVINPTNALYTFAAVPLAGTVNGLVAIKTLTVPAQVPVTNPPADPLTPLAAAIVPSLINAVPGTDLSTVVAAINALTVATDVVHAEAQLAPSIAALGAAEQTFHGARQFQNLWLARQDDVMCGQVSQRLSDEQISTCRDNDPHSGWWVKGFGYYSSQSPSGAFPGYDGAIQGVMVAYDAPLDDSKETRVGLGLGYAQSSIRGRQFSASADFTTELVTAYISHEPGPWFVTGEATAGWNDYTGTRNISFTGVNRTAQSDYSGQAYTAMATTGYHFLMQQDVTITPIASLQYTRTNLDSYGEQGAGELNLKVNAQKYDFVESGLGVKVARPFGYDNKTYVPETHFKLFHALNNPDVKNTATLESAGQTPIITPSYATADNTYDVGAGLTLLSCACSARTWSVEAVYDYYWTTQKYHANQAMVKFTSRF